MKKRVLALLVLGSVLCMTAGCSQSAPVATSSPDKEIMESKTPEETGVNEAEEAGEISREESLGNNLGLYLMEENYYIYRDDENGYKSIGNVSNDTPCLNEADALVYPELAKAMEAEFSYIKDTWFNESIDSIVASEEDSYAVELYNNVSSKVLRADDNCVSIYREWTSYTGGAHGMYSKTGYNFDTQKGKLLSFGDVVKDEDTFYDMVDKKLLEQVGPEEYGNLTSIEDYRASMEEYDFEPDWTLEYDGVTIYFNPYTIGPYAAGEHIIKVFFDEADIFEEYYTNVPESYIYPIRENIPEFIDVDGDGVKDEVKVFTQQENPDYEETNIYVGYKDEVSLVAQDTLGSEEAYLVKDGENVRLIMTTKEYNDGNSTFLYDIKSGKVIGDYLWGGPSYFDPDNEDASLDDVHSMYINRSKKAVLTNPESMDIYVMVYAMGNYMARNLYRIDDKAGFASITGAYKPTIPRILQTRRDVPCDMVDGDGKIIESGILPEGMYVMIESTDGQTYADLLEVDKKDVSVNEIDEDYKYMYTEDNSVSPVNPERIYRIYFDEDGGDFGKYVDGESEDQVFYGVVYAG